MSMPGRWNVNAFKFPALNFHVFYTYPFFAATRTDKLTGIPAKCSL